MSNLKRFWTAVESLPSLAAVEAEWHNLLGREFRLVQPFLRATQKLALSFPAEDGIRYYEVIEHTRNDLVGICNETGETIALSRSQLVVYELDQRRLATQVANALGPSAANQIATKEIRLFSLGSFRRTLYSVAAFLIYPSTENDVASGAAWLISQGLAPFLVLTPTRQYVPVELDLRLRSIDSATLPLADVLVVSDDGTWTITRETIGAALPDLTVEDEPLGVRAQEMLVAMHKLKAFDSDSRQTTEAIARAMGDLVDANSVKSVVSELATRRLVKTRRYRGGGCWLTESGRRRAEKLNSSWRNGSTVSTPFAHR
jgi:hypothetical protein